MTHATRKHKKLQILLVYSIYKVHYKMLTFQTLTTYGYNYNLFVYMH